MAVLRSLLLGLFLGAAVTSAAQAKVFDPVTFTLDNGLQVVVIENHRSGLVTQMVWYRVGAMDETPGKSGLAHFLEHLMFKGTHDVGVGEYSRIVARLGGRENAFTTWDYTAYFQVVAVQHLDRVMQLEADRMHNLVLDQKNVETERAVVMEERRMRTDNNPGALLNEAMDAALFQNHPYHRPVIGWGQEITGLNMDDALAFYGRWYAPNNAILVVAGDVTPDQVRQLAQKWYGAIPKVDLPARPQWTEPVQHGERRVTLKDPKVRQPQLVRAYLAPSARFGDGQVGGADQSLALQVLAEIIGGGSSSHLYRDVVVSQRVADAAQAWYDAAARDYGSFGFALAPRHGVSMDKAEAALDREIDRVLTKGVTAQEVAKAKTLLTVGMAYKRDSIQTGAHVLGAALASGQSIDDVETWPDRIQAVTVEQVNAAAKQVLVRDRSVTGTLLPDPTKAALGPDMSGFDAPSREVR